MQWCVQHCFSLTVVAAAFTLVLGVVLTGQSYTKNVNQLQLLNSIQSDKSKAVSQSLVDDSVLGQKSYPHASREENISRDIVSAGQSNGVLIKGIRVQPVKSASGMPTQVTFAVNASADYASIKYWLSNLMSRYSTMAVSSFAMQSTANDTSKLEMTMTLTVVVKD